jgi:sigma-B regulation protein RsbU (phosphoserine phosphatase)
MPRVAVVSVALFIIRLFISGTPAYSNTPLRLLGPLTLLAVTATVLYFGVKILIRLKRMLLWRVRRRLVITYLFVGLTPIVLLLTLGFVAVVGGSSQALVRTVIMQFDSTERQALDQAKALADGLIALPAGDVAARAWLEERATLVRAALPGARISVWRANGGSDAGRVGEGVPAQLFSASVSEETRGVGFDTGAPDAALPSWLGGVAEWSGFAYLPPPPETDSAHGTPSLRAVARRASNGRAVAVLVTVPVSRALVGRLRENTGLVVRPFFLDARRMSGDDQREGGGGEAHVSINTVGETDARIRINDGGRVREVDFARDQFGEPLPKVSMTNFWSPVFLNSTEWESGQQTALWSFIVEWSWAAGVAQLWGDEVGDIWWQLLYTIGLVFLVLELLALMSAAWMTRAVTGTVHKLYRATEFIKRGDFSHRIRTRSHDQLGELALAFNDMSANIESLLADRVERERLEREIEIAHEVQAQLFPRSVPELRTVEMTGECRAARGVAGDYYDFVEVAPGLLALALGDVSGKGISASLVMSNLQASLRAQVAATGERVRLVERESALSAVSGSSPVETTGGMSGEREQYVLTALDGREAVASIAASVNEQLCRSTDSNRFATLFLAIYDDQTRALRYTNAGHNPPFHVRSNGEIERLKTGGTVIGAFDWVSYEEGGTTLAEGDLLVLYSDGITEAQNATGEEFGEERLAEFVAARRTESVDALRRALFDEVDRWTGDAERNDDQTLLILKAKRGDD